MNWITYISQFVIIACLVWLCIERLRQKPKPFIPPPPRAPEKLLPVPQTPIDRNEFLQARVAYLVHLRDVGIEVDEGQDKGEKLPSGVRKVRPATDKEIFELVNLRDEEHIKGLLVTWDAAQKRQRDPL